MFTVYVDVDSTLGPVSLTVLSSGAQGLPKNFKIQIFQLRDGNHRMAPKNCLQYYTSIQGVVESFNYQLGGLQENSTIMQGYMVISDLLKVNTVVIINIRFQVLQSSNCFYLATVF